MAVSEQHEVTLDREDVVAAVRLYLRERQVELPSWVDGDGVAVDLTAGADFVGVTWGRRKE